MPLAHTPKPVKERADASYTISPTDGRKAGPSPKKLTRAPSVRRSIGEWESGAVDPKPGASGTHPKPYSPKKKTAVPASAPAPVPAPAAAPAPVAIPRQRQGSVQALEKSVERTPVETDVVPPKLAVDESKPAGRMHEYRVWLRRAKAHVNESRNLKTDLKSGILQAIENMHRLMQEAVDETAPEAAPANKKKNISEEEKGIKKGTELNCIGKEGQELIRLIKEQGEKIDRTQKDMETLKETMALQHATTLEQPSYASVTAAQHKRQGQSALHSIVITSKDETHTGEEVMKEVRKVVNAKDGWVTVERVRKVKDKKVIIGCKTEEERERIKERLKSADDRLIVEEMKNQDPMMVLKDVLLINSDEDVLKALRNQNGGVFHGLDKKDDRVEIKFKRRARNPLTNHIILRVSPQIYNRVMTRGSVHIDMQKIWVADQSPLVQCSVCLAYGHGRRFCKDTIPKCSHCGGPHMRNQCADYLVEAAPTCCNCVAAKMENAEHNAFSSECPVRRRWEALARAKVAYC